MANWWERDAIVSQAATGGNFWERDAVVDEQPQFGGMAMNATAGANETLYSIAGAPVDLMRGAMNLGVRGFNAATGSDVGMIPENSFGGSRHIAETLGAVRPEFDPQNTKAQTAAERVARGAGQGVAGTVLPAAVVGGLARGGVLGAQGAEIGAQVAGRSNSVRAAGADALAGGTAGAGATAAMELTPDRYDPLAGLIGGLAGGVAGTAATGLPGVMREGVRAGREFAAPLSQAGRERLAGESLRDAATDPTAARAVLDNQPAELVPGSRPTTGQVTGDMGLLAAERAAQSRDPAAFQQRRADQNAARREAMDAIQPSGSSEAVTRALRQRLADIDRDTASDLDLARDVARGRNQQLGQSVRAEDAGDQIRDTLQRRRDLTKEKERRLWAAVDPDGTFALPPQDTRAARTAIMADLPASARRPGGEEAAIYSVVERYSDVMSFRELAALRSRVSEAMAYERSHGGDQAWGRLSRLRGAIESDLEKAAERRALVEEQMVADGQMRREDTIAAAIQRDIEGLNSAQQAATGTGGSSSVGGGSPGGRASIAGVLRAEGEGPLGPRYAQGDPGLSQDAGGAGATLGAASGRAGVASEGRAGMASTGAAGGAVPGGDAIPLRRDGGGGLRGDLQNAGGGGGARGAPQASGDPRLSGVPGGSAPRGDTARAVGSLPALPTGARIVANDGPLGPSVDGLQGRYDDAVAWLTQAQTGDVRGALSHPEIGPIDLVWGHAGSGRSDGAGLAKIAQFHPEVLDDLPQRLAEMRVVKASGNRVQLESDRTKAGVRLEYDGQQKTWLLTAFDPGEKSRRAGGTTLRSDALRQTDASSASPATFEYRAFDGAAKDRLDRATEATRNRANIFDNRQIKPLLARSADHAAYTTESARVAARIFVPGSSGFERMQRLREATGPNAKRTMAAIEGYAIDTLRKAAMNDDGTFDPAKVERWRRGYADALRAFPDLDIRVQDAARTSATVAEYAAARKAALDDAQKGAVGRLVGAEDPQDIARIVGGLFGRQDSVQQLGALRRAIGKDEQAMQGLRKATAEFLSQRLVSNTEAATSGRTLISADQMQTFVRQNRNALRTVFSADEVSTLEAIAADLQRANRSLSAVRIPGQSNTVQDALAVTSGDSATTILGKLATAGMASGGALAGFGVGGGGGAALGAGAAALVGALRQNGIAQVEDLVQDALLNPNRARMLLSKVPANNSAREEAMFRSLARRYAKTALSSAAIASGSNDDRRPTAPTMPQITVTPLPPAQRDPLADAMMGR
ncbi:hypothetical protein [Aureimonas mangrovi]|uniref:hypothetical protein n=1 Tax=Aureimonas mangrovi TaxID=2758041 RepID=UPI00163D421D|nr:hypothetical protein [Aureimonas mangrovi]